MENTIEQQKRIHAADSAKIDELLQEMTKVIKKHDDYFLSDDQRKRLRDMKAELDSTWEYIEYYL